MQRWIWGGLVLFFVLFSLAPNMYELSRMNDLHPDRYFELVHNFYTDYNFYLSRIREGREGAWTATEKYTSEPHKGSYLQIFYVWMGEVSAWIGVPWHRSGDTYLTARIALAGALLFVVAFVAKSLFNRFRWQLTAFILATTAGSWPILVLHKGEWRFGGYMPWWTIMDSLQRITFIPHLLAGQTLILFLLMALGHRPTMERSGNWLFLGILALFLGIIYPPGLFFTGIVYGVFVILDLFIIWPFAKKQLFMSWITIRILGGSVVFLMGAPALIYVFLMTQVYPWKRLIDYGLLHAQQFQLGEYLLAVGPVLVLGGIGVVWALVKRERKLFIFVAWVMAWLGCVILFENIPQQSPLRFTEMASQIPLAILTVFLLSNLSHLGHLWKKTIITLTLIFILVNLLQLYSSWRWQKEFIDQKIIATQPLVPTGTYVMYPLKDFIDGIIFIQDHTKRTDVVLSETTAGNYIPVYSGNTVYVGQSNTIRAEQKELIVKDFFSGHMGESNASVFLKANNIHYIFFGPQETEDGGVTDLAQIYPFLTQIYKNSLIRVYSW